MRTHQRIITLTIVVVFLGTALASGLAVLWQFTQGDNGGNTAEQEANVQDALSEVPKEDRLQGKQIQDFTPTEKVSELKIQDIKKGDGKEVPAGATVTAHYTGALAKNGTIFQSSHDLAEPVDFSLKDVIPGWQKGVPGMKVGGKRRLVIPAELAYGEAGAPPTIGPNEPLVFDIEVTKLHNQ